MGARPVRLACSFGVLALFGGLLTAAPGPAQAAAAPRYTVTDLGALAGGTSRASAISNAGVVVGTSAAANLHEHAVKWSQTGAISDLGLLPGGGSSNANAVNDAGQVVGLATRSDGGYGYPVRWSAAGVIQDLGGPITNRLGWLNGIDPAGRAVGGQRPADSEGSPLGILYAVDGTTTELFDGPSTPLDIASGINARGQIVGGSYLWKNGFVTHLPSLTGLPDRARAYAINIGGQVVGASMTSDLNANHAVLWKNGAVSDLGAVAGIANSYARAINASGQVVGQADPGCSPCGPLKAWVWTPGGNITVLDGVIPATSGWTLTDATGVNDLGQIVGTGTYNGKTHAYRLDPVFHATINFQPAGAAVPAGYAVDSGAVYGGRSNGLSYGWNLDNSAQTRDRDAAEAPDQRYDTVIHLQKATPARTWELAVPNGVYLVHAVAGDSCCTDSVFKLTVEGATLLAGTPSTSTHWFESTVRVTVTDGRLTIGNGAGSVNNKINYLDVSKL